MNYIRELLYRPKRTDKSLMARFYFADLDLNAVAAELDSFDGRKDPDGCSRLVNKLRNCQDKLLDICSKMLEEIEPGIIQRSREFRAKFPDDIMTDNLSGQLWFGAGCLAAGSSIMHKEHESEAMRPLAKAVTKSLEKVRVLLREQCLSPTPSYSEKIRENLKIFDRLFAEFEYSYVQCMVHVKSIKEYELHQDLMVLFSETLARALKHEMITQDMVDFYEPSLMFAVPRLAIVYGLLHAPTGPLNVDRSNSDFPDLFLPFKNLLKKIRELLYTLAPAEVLVLEMLLCQQEEPANITVKLVEVEKMIAEKEVTQVRQVQAEKLQEKLNIEQQEPQTQSAQEFCDTATQKEGKSPGEEGSSLSTEIVENVLETVVRRGSDDGAEDKKESSGEKKDLQQEQQNCDSEKQQQPQEQQQQQPPSTTSIPPSFSPSSVSSTARHHRHSSQSHSSSRSSKDGSSRSSHHHRRRSSRDVYANQHQQVEIDCTGTDPEVRQVQRPLQESSDENNLNPASTTTASNSTTTTNTTTTTSSTYSPRPRQRLGRSNAKRDSKRYPMRYQKDRRAKFKSTEDLLHRLYVCISGAADQLQSNYAGDFRSILGSVFVMNISQDGEGDENDEDEVDNAEEGEEGQAEEAAENEGEANADEDDDEVYYSARGAAGGGPPGASAAMAVPQSAASADSSIDDIIDDYARLSTATTSPRSMPHLASRFPVDLGTDALQAEISRGYVRDTLRGASSNDDLAASASLSGNETSPTPSSSAPTSRKRRSNNPADGGQQHQGRVYAQNLDLHLQDHQGGNGGVASPSTAVAPTSRGSRRRRRQQAEAGEEGQDDFDDVDGRRVFYQPEPALIDIAAGAAVSVEEDLEDEDDHLLEDDLIEDDRLPTEAVGQDSDQFVDGYHHSQGHHHQAIHVESPPAWVPDEDAPTCMGCTDQFTLFRRRHHCRSCGLVFCNRCSSHSMALPHYGIDRPVRVCNRCILIMQYSSSSTSTASTNQGGPSNPTAEGVIYSRSAPADSGRNNNNRNRYQPQSPASSAGGTGGGARTADGSSTTDSSISGNNQRNDMSRSPFSRNFGMVS